MRGESAGLNMLPSALKLSKNIFESTNYELDKSRHSQKIFFCDFSGLKYLPGNRHSNVNDCVSDKRLGLWTRMHVGFKTWRTEIYTNHLDRLWILYITKCSLFNRFLSSPGDRNNTICQWQNVIKASEFGQALKPAWLKPAFRRSTW